MKHLLSTHFIYSFYQFLLAYLSNGDSEDQYIIKLKNKRLVTKPIPHMFPFKYIFSSWYIGEKFTFNTMMGTFQYVLIKLCRACIIFFMSIAGVYEQGYISLKTGYVYVAFLTNFSQIIAMYCLVMFYKQFDDDLKNIRPIAKFLCIKAVVFFTFWQGVIIAILIKADVIMDSATYTAEQTSTGLQDFIICIEMCLASLAHVYAFPDKEFWNQNIHKLEYPSLRLRILNILWPNNTLDNQFTDNRQIDNITLKVLKPHVLVFADPNTVLQDTDKNTKKI